MPGLAQPNGIPALADELANVYVGLPENAHTTVMDVNEVALVQLSFDGACAFRKTGIMENKRMGIKILTKRMDFINQFWLRTKDIWTTIILTYIHKYNCMAEDIKYKHLMQ